METGEIMIYLAPDRQTSIDGKLENETIWLNLNQMATLFERDKSFIFRHLSNCFKEQELDYGSVFAKSATTKIFTS